MRHSRCSRAYQVDTGKGSRIATAPSSSISSAREVRGHARDESALELAVQPRAIVGRRAERPTVPEGLGANIAEVGLAEEAPR